MSAASGEWPEDFLTALSSPAPAPAAGSAVAYAAALAAALVLKVCRITLAKKQSPFPPLADMVLPAVNLKAELLRLAEEDRAAVAGFFEAVKGKSADAKKILEEKRFLFTLIPLGIGENSAAVGELASRAHELVWSGVRDDAAAAVLLAMAAGQASAGLVRTNLRFAPDAPWKLDVEARLANLSDRLG